MTSTIGPGHEGGSNEDVEADEAARTSDARSLDWEDLMEEAEQEEEYGQFVDPESSQEQWAQEEGVLPTTNGLDQAEVEFAGQTPDEDFPQLDRDLQPSQDDDPGDELGSSTPLQRSPLASPLGSGSIPDDTPSLQDSLASSPAKVASPSTRRPVARTPSGALQPFDRRFETRLNASPTGTPRAESPAFLTPHSRQISISSRFSGISSQDGDSSTETSQAPWEVIRWTKLKKLTGQAFSEAGKRNFGRPTCMAVSALIAVGTSKGLILGFDYHQTLKIIIGQGTKATECGSVTALAIAADYSTIASGHANGYIFTWEVNRPARPFLQIAPLDYGVLGQPQHSDGHMVNSAILHIGFLGTRHTALVSADAGGMAFSHLATRGLGPVTRTVKTTRLLGRYPSADTQGDRPKKPSSVLAFSPLPLGNVEQATDALGLTALLTPYLLVIVSTTPIAQTQHKSARPKEISPHSTLSGCLAWFPSVKLKHTSTDAAMGTSTTKLVYCWSNLLTVLEVKVVREKTEDPQKPPSLEFYPRSRWRAEEAIVAVQWLSRSVIGVLTISQRLLIVEDGSLRVTDSVDLLHRHIYHQDLFSHQLHAVVEQLNSADPSLHGVVADAFHMSFKVYKGRTFLLGFHDLSVGTLSNWADRLMALMEAGDHIAALRLATEYYSGGANNVTIGLPDTDTARYEIVRERLLAMISASLHYSFSQHDADRASRLRELAEICFEACIIMNETEYLFRDVFDYFQEADEDHVFMAILEPCILDGEVRMLPPEVVKAMVSYFIGENQAARLEELLCRLDPYSYDLDEITVLCRQHMLYDALIYVWTQAIGDHVTPFIDLLALVKMLMEGGEDEDWSNNPFYESAGKVFAFLAYSLTGRYYPSGTLIDDDEAFQAKTELYAYLFAGTATAWPKNSKKVLRTTADPADERAYPYLSLLLRLDTANFMTMLNEAFEDSFLNEADDDLEVNGKISVNGTKGVGHKTSRQQIIEILQGVMLQGEFEPQQVIYLDMFVARSLSKYPGQIILSGTVLNNVLRRLCGPPYEALRDDCQLSVEYLLASYRPPDTTSLIAILKQARFFRVLKSVYRGERMYTALLETYFEDSDDREGVFDCISFCLRPGSGLNDKQLAAIKQVISNHLQELVDSDTIITARTLAGHASDMLQSSIDAIPDSHKQFIFLRALLEPSLLREKRFDLSPLPVEQQSRFVEHYVQLMCRYEPMHVADYARLLPSSDLRLEKVLPAMERSGVIDAAVALLARDGLARDAMDRLAAHLQTLESALTGLVNAAVSNPEVTASQETCDDLVEDLQKYTKVGIWLCQGQSASTQRKPRPRSNMAWDLDENDLDLDEFIWLNLVDVVAQVAQHTTAALQVFEDHPSEHTQDTFDGAKLISALRTNVQQVFTALMAANATPTTASHEVSNRQPADQMSFLRVLRAFLTRAAKTSPSLADLRAVLQDIFSAYAFEQGVLTLAHELLGSDVFADIHEANLLRQKGWRPRSQVCEQCKRRAWGTGIGEAVWDEWVLKEQEREAAKARKMLERGGGEQARRMSRGKAKAAASAVEDETAGDGEENRRLVLVVFACRHVFHRVCLDQEYRDGKTPARATYQCPICTP